MPNFSPERWRTLSAHLDDLLDLPDDERAVRIAILQERDSALASELQSLLDEHRSLDKEEFLTAESSAPVPSALAGQRLGPYTLVAPLGEGGMGEVWLADQREPVQRKVAIKIIKHGMDTAQVVARFEIERQALALMDHSAVAKVFDAGSTPLGRPYFVMEYVRGLSITDHCDRYRLTTRQRLELFMRVCDGVQHAHQKAVIHRDIKPSNVLVLMQDGVAVPKIIDFGVAKATGERLTERSLHTAIGALIGTPEYMSPEQAGTECWDVDTRTDVYSLGVLLYELLVGVLPFDSKDLPEGGFEGIRRAIREEEPKRPSARLSGLGVAVSTEMALRRQADVATLKRQLRGELDWIVIKALEKDRLRRYGSPAELAADIGRYLDKLPVLAGPPGTGYRARKFVQRHRLGVSLSALGVLLFAAFALVMALQSARIASERDRANREATTANRALSVLTDLFEVSDPSESRGNTITAREILDRGAGKIDTELKDEPLVQAKLLLTLGEVYRSLGLYAAAKPLMEKSMTLRRDVLGKQNPATVESINALASILQDQGKFVDAEGYFREALAERRSTLGADDPDTVTSINNLGLVLQLEGRLPEAEPYLRDALELERRKLGPDDPDVLMGLHNLGLLLLNEGKPAEAEPYMRDVLERCRRTLGDDHPHTLSAISNLALDLVAVGNLAEAESLYREALATRRRVLGEDHPQTLLSLFLLGHALLAQGRLPEAETFIHDSLDRFGRALGPEHPRTLMALNCMGSLRQAQGQLDEAEKYLRRSLDGRHRALGDDHPDTIETVINLASVLQDERSFAESESAYREALEHSRKRLGVDHPTTLKAMAGLGDLLTSEGQPQEAEKILGEALASARRALPPTHATTGRILWYLGRCLASLGRYPEAEAALIEAQQILAKSEPLWSPKVAKDLADLNARWGHRGLKPHV